MPFIFVFGGLIFIIIGYFMFFRPEEVIKFIEQLNFNNEVEPSDLYISSTKFGGVVLTIIGIYIISSYFLIKFGIIQ